MIYLAKKMGLFRRCMTIIVVCATLLPVEMIFGQSCIDDIREIYAKEQQFEDTSFPRLYIICPRRIYDMGHIDFNGNVISSDTGSVIPPIPLRANMTIRCGDQGSRDNLCWFTGGDLHMDGTAVLGISDKTIENVSIEGFVFMGARQHSLWATKPGSITFKDCEFRDFVNSQVPIMLDYYDASNPSTELVTTFLDCEFRDNRYFGMGSQTALIYGNSVQNRIIVESSLFENNDMIWNNTRPDTHSFLIESLGPVAVGKTCFQDNEVGASDIVVFGNTFKNDLNFVTNSSGQLCPYFSVFQTIQQFDSFTPVCVEASETACNRYVTSIPTIRPTISPSPYPTTISPTMSSAPSSSPTSSPTITGQPTITPVPTGSPSEAPTGSPSEFGATKSPNTSPSKAPIPSFVWPTVNAAEPVSEASTCATATKMLLLCSTALYFIFL